MDPRPRILIVEDSRLQARRLKEFLEQHGFHVILAFNGQEGLEAAQKHKPDLILTDVVMPVLDGFRMCRALRNEKTLEDIPVVMVTSMSNPEDVLRGLEAGADSYVSKPYEGKVLISRIRDVLLLPRLPRSEESAKKLQVVLGGKRYVIHAARQQILSLLLSTYEDAVLQNLKLREMRAKLVSFNETLEKKVAERTAALQKEIAERKRTEKEKEKLIAELTAARDALHFKATHDDLTRQRNRPAIIRTLRNELARSKREGVAVSVIIMDVDHFKRVNDNHGHLAGDGVLRGVAQRIASEMRPYDSVGRYGGEEFIVVLPGCDREGAKQVGERLRRSFSDRPITTPEGEFGITMSLGVTTVDGGAGPDVDEVIRQADTALYRAKNAGRNRFECSWESGSDKPARHFVSLVPVH
ncbi:MAG: diguanylate cyclase [Pseudomonadota bacterium]